MSSEAVSWAWDEVTGLTATQKCILLAIADWADENNECSASYDQIQDRTGANRKTVSNALKRFVEMKLIEKRRRFADSTIYQLLISANISTKESMELGYEVV